MRPVEVCWWCRQPGSRRESARPNRRRQGLRTDRAQRRLVLPNGIVEPRYGRAEVAEQADASVSKTDVRKDVRVRLPLSAPNWRCHLAWNGTVWPVRPTALDKVRVLWILLRP